MPLKIKYNRLEEVTNKLSNLEKAVKLGHLNTALDVAGEVPSLNPVNTQPQLTAPELVTINSIAGAGNASKYAGNTSAHSHSQWIDL